MSLLRLYSKNEAEDLKRQCFKVTLVCLPLERFCMTQGYLHLHSKTP